ncbi:MAG: DUF92 domain-containing protein [Armatimonadetes bacterium]|nr:DUF92 domain-containing protein [Armatimonadota bacterium]
MLYAVAVAALCFVLRLLTWDGAVAAAVVGGLVWEAGRWPWVVPLLLFFITSSLLSRAGRATKREAGLDAAPRRAIQVFANGGPQTLCAALFPFHSDNPALAAAALAGFAAANADTWGTEIGSLLGKRFYRIGTLAEATRGASGAISVAGLIASFAGAAVVSAAAPLIGRPDLIGLLAVIGFGASLMDSVLGDLVQARYTTRDGATVEAPTPGSKHIRGIRWMTNDAVNLIAVSCATAAGYLAAA